jgi:hypothetical protein
MPPLIENMLNYIFSRGGIPDERAKSGEFLTKD